MSYLLITVIADVVGVALLGKAKGFTEPWYLIAGIICMMVGFLAFSFATKTVPVGFANAVWSGLSLVLVLAAGHVFFGESLTFMQAIFALMILVGAIGLQLMEKA